MLGDAGFEAYAPDWPGHGESDKPSASSFSYSQQAYLDGLAAFVEAVGIKKPFALAVQVRRSGQI
jgi:pimeloyl-ACP methyl ester carboxylesterase